MRRFACCCSTRSSRPTTFATTNTARREMARRVVCKVADVPQNGLKEVEIEGGLKLVVANSGGEFFGFQATCPHQDVPLCEGVFDGSTLTCHMHLWQWNVGTGPPLGPAEPHPQKYSLAAEADPLYLAGAETALDVCALFSGTEST